MAGYTIRCKGASGAWSEMGRKDGTENGRADTFSTANGRFSVQEIIQWDQALTLVRRNDAGDQARAYALLAEVFIAVEAPAIR